MNSVKIINNFSEISKKMFSSKLRLIDFIFLQIDIFFFVSNFRYSNLNFTITQNYSTYFHKNIIEQYYY